MKKLFNTFGVSTLIVILALLVSTRCTPQKQQDDPSVDDPKETTYEKPSQTVTIERAQELLKTYLDREDRSSAEKPEGGDARYGWHDLDFYKNYIGWLEQEAKRKGVKISGLRIYYAAYPDKDDEVQGGYQTFLYVPTYFDKKENAHKAFDLYQFDDNGNPIPFDKIIPELAVDRGSYQKDEKTGANTTGKVFKKASMLGSPSSSANLTAMCRPNCE